MCLVQQSTSCTVTIKHQTQSHSHHLIGLRLLHQTQHRKILLHRHTLHCLHLLPRLLLFIFSPFGFINESSFWGCEMMVYVHDVVYCYERQYWCDWNCQYFHGFVQDYQMMIRLYYSLISFIAHYTFVAVIVFCQIKQSAAKPYTVEQQLLVDFTTSTYLKNSYLIVRSDYSFPFVAGPFI